MIIVCLINTTVYFRIAAIGEIPYPIRIYAQPRHGPHVFGKWFNLVYVTRDHRTAYRHTDRLSTASSSSTVSFN